MLTRAWRGRQFCAVEDGSFNDRDNDGGNVSRLAKAKASVKGWLLSGVSAQSSPRTHTDSSKSIRTTVDVLARYASAHSDAAVSEDSFGTVDFAGGNGEGMLLLFFSTGKKDSARILRLLH